MKTHYMKIAPVHFRDVVLGLKTAELRLNDRGFRVDDLLFLEEYVDGKSTGHHVIRRIEHICPVDFIIEGYVLLSVVPYLTPRIETTPCPKGVKFKSPDIESPELDKLYNLVFDSHGFDASWAGRLGHYLYGYTNQVADDQDGYLYLWPVSYVNGNGWRWLMSASPSMASAKSIKYVEINI